MACAAAAALAAASVAAALRRRAAASPRLARSARPRRVQPPHRGGVEGWGALETPSRRTSRAVSLASSSGSRVEYERAIRRRAVRRTA